MAPSWGLEMRVVAAIGGNALSQCGQPVMAERYRQHVTVAAEALADIVRAGHQLIITCGNGPLAQLLTLQGAADTPGKAFRLGMFQDDTDGMYGHPIEQNLGNALGYEHAVAQLLIQVMADLSDPAFDRRITFVGPTYGAENAKTRAKATGEITAQDGDMRRGVLQLPKPVEISDICLLLDKGVRVICAGVDAIGAVRRPDRSMMGTKAVIDQDAASALLAAKIGADALLLLTDVKAVYTKFRTFAATPIHILTPAEGRALNMPNRSMGPKLAAACDFADRGGIGVIGRLSDTLALLDGTAGTRVAQTRKGAG